MNCSSQVVQRLWDFGLDTWSGRITRGSRDVPCRRSEITVKMLCLCSYLIARNEKSNLKAGAWIFAFLSTKMVLSSPASLETLLKLGVDIHLPDCCDDEAVDIVQKCLNILQKRATMLWDYFSLKISTNENDELMFYSLPILLDRWDVFYLCCFGLIPFS